MRVTMGVSSLANSWRSLVEMQSGPVALCGFRFLSSLCTPSLSMLKVFIGGYGQPVILGMLFGSSSVNTLVNCWLRIVAFVWGSL